MQTAHSSLLSASMYRLPEYDIENAEWLKERVGINNIILITRMHSSRMRTARSLTIS